MSDEKREKLREYLRNNRPKNSVNLGNSSDNKEISNKNLENDLNLDNSNLENSQISSNKNSNQRDYDKEPLIVKNYSPLLTFIFCLIASIIAIFVILLYKDNFYHIAIFTSITLCSFFRIANNKNNFRIVITNSQIKYIANSKTEKIIFVNNIKNIKWCIPTDAHLVEINKGVSKIIIYGGILVMIVLFIFKTFVALFILTIPIYSYFINTSFYFILNKKYSFKFYNGLIIYDKDDNMIDFLPNSNDYKEIKKYFLAKKGINLDFIDTKFIPLEF